MDLGTTVEMPGGDNFRDVTDLFIEAARDMEPEEVIFMKGFTLQDAMSVLEIGEPRLDSGITPQEERRPPFNPLFQFLPEEICWILDRSFACEMEWHAGNTLSQTVFTLLYVHQLAEINPDFIPLGMMTRGDRARPPELVTLVLRAALFGLLKSCDLAWREMARDKVKDMEDWQSEKCDVSLLEGISVRHILASLDEACSWIQSTSKVVMPGRDGLLARILLRKTLLELMDCHICVDAARFQALVALAREQLLSVQSRPCPEPSPNSQAALAFDPLVARRLNSFSPLRKHQLPPQEQVWQTLGRFLRGFEEIKHLGDAPSLLTWQDAGYLRAWTAPCRQRFAYMRSYTQTAFYDGVLVLNRYSLAWIVENFFSEALDVSYDNFVAVVKRRWQGVAPPLFGEFERLLRRLVLGNIDALYQNAPRRRRCFAKSLVDWHALYDMLVNLTSNLVPMDDASNDVVLRVPDAILLWRLTIVREVVLSGFQMELYSMEERAFAYWYVAQVIEAHLDCIDNWVPVVSKISVTYSDMLYQREFLTALQSMCMGMFSVMIRTKAFPLERTRLNLLRRYKWAFRPSYDSFCSDVVAPPNFMAFMSARDDLVADEAFSPSGTFEFAGDILQQLKASPPGLAGHWDRDRMKLLQNLIETCANLSALPSTMRDLLAIETLALKWDPEVTPWFPSIK